MINISMRDRPQILLLILSELINFYPSLNHQETLICSNLFNIEDEFGDNLSANYRINFSILST